MATLLTLLQDYRNAKAKNDDQEVESIRSSIVDYDVTFAFFDDPDINPEIEFFNSLQTSDEFDIFKDFFSKNLQNAKNYLVDITESVLKEGNTDKQELLKSLYLELETDAELTLLSAESAGTSVEDTPFSGLSAAKMFLAKKLLENDHETIVKFLDLLKHSHILNKLQKDVKEVCPSPETEKWLVEMIEQVRMGAHRLDKAAQREEEIKKAKSKFDEAVKKIGNMVLVSEHPKDSLVQHQPSSPESSETIYNNDGFGLPDSTTPGFHKGAPLTHETTGSPIGYNIHLPPQGVRPKNVIVHIYGGADPIIKEKAAYHPDRLTDVEKELLNQGTIVITLNLADLLKLDVFQRNMPEDLHQELHACIDQFYRTLVTSPEVLHPHLKELQIKGKNIVLYGESFGGLMTIRHAELYPHTFTGYISHDGPLSKDMDEKADRLKRRGVEPWLDPSNKVEVDKIADPLLLMQNLNDNNVNAKTTLAFYKLLEERNKADLARVCVTPVAKKAVDDNRDYNNMGHFIPENAAAFLRYLNTVSSFIQNGPSKLPEVTKWQSYEQDIIANKFYRSATIQDYFIAEIHDRTRFSTQESFHLKVLANIPIESEKLKKSALKIYSNADEVWNLHYKPLFYSMHFANKLSKPKYDQDRKKEINRLIKNGALTDDMVKKALAMQAPLFCQFLKEFHNIDISHEDFASDDMVQAFKNSLEENMFNPSVMKYLLSAVYVANPELLHPHYMKFEKDKKLQQELVTTRAALTETVLKQHGLVSDVWKKAGRQLIVMNRLTKSRTKANTSTTTAKETTKTSKAKTHAARNSKQDPQHVPVKFIHILEKEIGPGTSQYMKYDEANKLLSIDLTKMEQDHHSIKRLKRALESIGIVYTENNKHLDITLDVIKAKVDQQGFKEAFREAYKAHQSKKAGR